MKTHASLVGPVLLLLGNARVPDEIAFRVESGTTLVRTMTQAFEMELESMTVTMNGEEVPAELVGEFDMSMQREDQYEITDVFEAMDGGRPTRLRRTFDRLGGRETITYKHPDDQQTDESDYESELEGKSVVFSWDEDEERFDVAFVEGTQGDSTLLEDLEEDMDLRDLLPPGEVEEGESWEVDVKVFDQTMEPGGDLRLEDTEGEEEEDSEDQFDENLSGTITATYKGTVEEDGVRLAVIAIEAEVQTFDDEEGAPEGFEGGLHTEFAFDLEGELRWNLAGHHAASYELAGDGKITLAQRMEGEVEDQSFEQAQVIVLAGSVRFGMEFASGR